MIDYQPARAAFRLLRDSLAADAALREELVRAFTLVLARYNTQIYENRFLVGGVVERLVAAAFRALGEAAEGIGVRATRFDLGVGGTQISVKGVFRPSASEIRLINTMGDSSNAQWEEPVIAVVSGLGLGYFDPGLLPGSTRRSKDAIAVALKVVRTLWQTQPELFVPLDIPYSRDDVAGSDVASRAVVDEILRYNFNRLRPFDARGPGD